MGACLEEIWLQWQWGRLVAETMAAATRAAAMMVVVDVTEVVAEMVVVTETVVVVMGTTDLKTVLDLAVSILQCGQT